MRISTAVERQKQKFTRQEAALKKFAEQNKIEFIYTAREDASGKNFTDRKEWNKIEKLVQDGDTIVFKDISRFTREAENGYKKYMELLNRGVNLIFIDNPTMIKPPFNICLDCFHTTLYSIKIQEKKARFILKVSFKVL